MTARARESGLELEVTVTVMAMFADSMRSKTCFERYGLEPSTATVQVTVCRTAAFASALRLCGLLVSSSSWPPAWLLKLRCLGSNLNLNVDI